MQNARERGRDVLFEACDEAAAESTEVHLREGGIRHYNGRKANKSKQKLHEKKAQKKSLYS